MIEGGLWLRRARLFEAQGVFATGNPSFYQSHVQSSMMIQNNWDKQEEQEALLDQVFAIVDPRRYKRYIELRRQKIVEQGVERVTYQGEGDLSPQELAEELEGFDFNALGVGGDLNFSGAGLNESIKHAT